jgi:hypothetical protein
MQGCDRRPGDAGEKAGNHKAHEVTRRARTRVVAPHGYNLMYEGYGFGLRSPCTLRKPAG